MTKRKAKAKPARLDKDRKAKPKTKLVGHFKAGNCIGPQSKPEALEYRDEEHEFDLFI